MTSLRLGFSACELGIITLSSQDCPRTNRVTFQSPVFVRGLLNASPLSSVSPEMGGRVSWAVNTHKSQKTEQLRVQLDSLGSHTAGHMCTRFFV